MTWPCYLGDCRLDKITPFVVEKFRIDKKQKDGVKDGTLNDLITTLKHIYNIAVRDGIIDKNPCLQVKKLKINQAKNRVLSPDEIRLLLNELEGQDKLMVEIALFTGMRLNEVLSLKWEYFDFSRNIVIFTQSKSGKLITIPLSGYLATNLLRYKGSGSFKDNYLFEHRELDKGLISFYSRRFSDILKAKLSDSKVSFHVLRHTFCSIQGDLGTGANVIRELLGHSNLAITTKYSHSNMEAKTQAVEAIANHVFKGEIVPVAKLGTA